MLMVQIKSLKKVFHGASERVKPMLNEFTAARWQGGKASSRTLLQSDSRGDIRSCASPVCA